MTEHKILVTNSNADYELVDSGDGQKLERFGSITLARPDPQALWPKHLKPDVWVKADATFMQSGKNAKWVSGGGAELPGEWQVTFSLAGGDIKFLLGLSTFKHTGIFPEQYSNWQWIGETIRSARSAKNQKISVLNLFGYTGGATLAALSAGAEVCHVDASKVSIGRAKQNVEISGLAASDSPEVRFILDDAVAFVKREARRGKVYDAIVMDPPAFGRGPKGEVWNIEKDLPRLIEACRNILLPRPLFILINGYAAGYSPIAYKNLLGSLLSDSSGQNSQEHIECGELAICESGHSGRLLPAGIFARYRSI